MAGWAGRTAALPTPAAVKSVMKSDDPQQGIQVWRESHKPVLRMMDELGLIAALRALFEILTPL